MPLTIEIKKSSATRNARRNTGITGLSIELQLVHLQNLSIQRDAIAQYLKNETEVTCVTEMLQDQLNFLNFIVQEDFPSPLAKDLWGFDPEENLSRSSKY
jgi:hypothetical protein